jgi:hypothetical protein
VGSTVGPLHQQSASQVVIYGTQRRINQKLIERIALRVTATNAMEIRLHRTKELGGFGISAAAMAKQGAGDGKSDLAHDSGLRAAIFLC